MLDTYFHVVVWYGDAIAQWRANNVHLKPGYEFFAQLLKAPAADAAALIEARFPSPRYIECVEKGSQSRFLMAKLNPSVTQVRACAGACLCLCLPVLVLPALRPATSTVHRSVDLTPQSDVDPNTGEPPVFSEDVNLKVFLTHLRKLVVEGAADKK